MRYTNKAWLSTVVDHLMTGETSGPMFFYGTKPDEAVAAAKKRSVGADIWTFFLMSGVEPDRVRIWFEDWQQNMGIIYVFTQKPWRWTGEAAMITGCVNSSPLCSWRRRLYVPLSR